MKVKVGEGNGGIEGLLFHVNLFLQLSLHLSLYAMKIMFLLFRRIPFYYKSEYSLFFFLEIKLAQNSKITLF